MKIILLLSVSLLLSACCTTPAETLTPAEQAALRASRTEMRLQREPRGPNGNY